MTFDDDMIRLGEGGPTFPCAKAGMEWPPPERINPAGTDQVWVRVAYSQITDDQRSQMSHVFRGALYELEPT